MNPSTWQFICNIVIFVCVLIGGLATFGTFYFGNKIDKLNSKKQQEYHEESSTEAANDRQTKYDNQMDLLKQIPLISDKIFSEDYEIEEEISVKLISSKPFNEVFYHGFGPQKYPLITNESTIACDKTKITEENISHYDIDLFYFLFFKLLNSTYHQGWYLRHKQPLIDSSTWHEPLASKEVDNSNIISFKDLPDEIKTNNIFFTNKELFNSNSFIFNLAHVFPMREFAFKLPPNTKILFVNDKSLGNLIEIKNEYCSIKYQIIVSGSGPGLPMNLYDTNKGFDEKEFKKYRTANYQISFVAKFNNSLDKNETKKYRWWVESLHNYFVAYFDWNRYQLQKK